MKSPFKEAQSKVDSLNDNEKVSIINHILESLDTPDPLIDKEWVKESRSRLKAMRSGAMKVHNYKDVIGKFIVPTRGQTESGDRIPVR